MATKTTAKKITKKEIAIEQWTHDGDKVLLVKCINRDGTSHGGFVWPKSGPVTPINWSRTADCESGGLFGWAWGLHIGDGRTPDACADWLVFATKPENVIKVDDGGTKAKAVPGEDGELPEVVYRGTMTGAMEVTRCGRQAWIEAHAVKSASASGYSGSASASGNRGSAAASGNRGSASASGDSGSASASGDSGSASASGNSGSASASGDRGSASASGYSGSASASGNSGSASASGDRGSASASGDSGSAAASGYRGSAAASGNRGSASASGDRGSASASGDSGSASASGNNAAIDVGPRAIGCATGRHITWIIRPGAKLAVGWMDPNNAWQAKLFDSAEMDLEDGDRVEVDLGEIINTIKARN